MFKWLFAGITCLLLTGCIVGVREPAYVYQEGYWYWGGTTYVWVPGRYVPRGTVVYPKPYYPHYGHPYYGHPSHPGYPHRH